MADQSFTRDDFEALAAKLDAMDLTDKERSYLGAIFGTVRSNSEVEGFGMDMGSLQIFAKDDSHSPGPGPGHLITYPDGTLVPIWGPQPRA
jgi:hypothetical protein